MIGDAVPGPLAFFAFRQQHGSRTVTHLLDRVWPRNPRRKPQQTGCRQPLILAVPFFPLMLLAQSAKCRGAGGRAPISHGSTQ